MSSNNDSSSQTTTFEFIGCGGVEFMPDVGLTIYLDGEWSKVSWDEAVKFSEWLSEKIAGTKP